MKFRFLSVAAIAALTALPAHAQAPDFGDDSSPWSNDGECDDPRFQGAGMAQTEQLARDERADATDCRNAFNAGTITLRGAAAPQQAGGKPAPGQPAAQAPQMITANGIVFGDDSNDWANDGECDDRRFVGSGMAYGLTRENVGRDASDCLAAFNAGTVTYWDAAASAAATQCASINWGDDSGDFPHDSDCDDPRFEGHGSAYVLNPDWLGKDASDCRRMCDLGMIGLRDY